MLANIDQEESEKKSNEYKLFGENWKITEKGRTTVTLSTTFHTDTCKSSFDLVDPFEIDGCVD